MSDNRSDDVKTIIRKTREDPVWYVENVLGESVWSTPAFNMGDIMRSVFRNRITAVKTAHGVGKSWLAARCAQAWMDAFPVDPSGESSTRVYTTAPTLKQVRDVLWAEIPRANHKANKKLPWNDECFKLQFDRGPNWFCHGMTSTPTNEQAFQGFHATNMLIIVDEACGVSETVLKQVRILLTAPNNHLLLIGNPVDPTSKFATYWKDDRDLSGIGRFTISVWDTPNFHAFGLTRYDFSEGTWRAKVGNAEYPSPHLVAPPAVAEIWDDVKSFEDPYWQGRVEGEFPTEHENQLIPADWIAKARYRELEPEFDSPRTFGLDVGEEGPDEAPLMDNWGGKCRIKFAIKTGRLNKLWDATERAYYDTSPRPENINVDATGVGAGVYDRLVEMNLPAQRMIMSHSATDNEVFANKRAEWWWHTRKRFDPDDNEYGQLDIPEDDKVLERQLMSIRYDTKDGRRRIESKKDARKRGVKSPDRADALMLSCAPVSDTPQGGSVWLSG